MQFRVPIVAHGALHRQLTGRQNLAQPLGGLRGHGRGINFYIHRYRAGWHSIPRRIPREEGQFENWAMRHSGCASLFAISTMGSGDSRQSNSAAKPDRCGASNAHSPTQREAKSPIRKAIKVWDQMGTESCCPKTMCFQDEQSAVPRHCSASAPRDF
jgi:hypothetical protein